MGSDGNFTYSAVIQIHYTNINAYQVSIAPNPLLNSTNIFIYTSRSHKKFLSEFMIWIGRLVKTLANAEMQAGAHRIAWNAEAAKR